MDEALAALSADSAVLYSKTGQPSIAPAKLLRALLLQAFYTIRSERQLMEQLDYYLLFHFVRIAALLVEAGKYVLVQRLMAVHTPPAHTRSSCRKGVNSTADHDWPFMILSG